MGTKKKIFNKNKIELSGRMTLKRNNNSKKTKKRRGWSQGGKFKEFPLLFDAERKKSPTARKDRILGVAKGEIKVCTGA